jgi:hypothetical protein
MYACICVARQQAGELLVYLQSHRELCAGPPSCQAWQLDLHAPVPQQQLALQEALYARWAADASRGGRHWRLAMAAAGGLQADGAVGDEGDELAGARGGGPSGAMAYGGSTSSGADDEAGNGRRRGNKVKKRRESEAGWWGWG